jgi:hypothetical protein
MVLEHMLPRTIALLHELFIGLPVPVQIVRDDARRLLPSRRLIIADVTEVVVAAGEHAIAILGDIELGDVVGDIPLEVRGLLAKEGL